MTVAREGPAGTDGGLVAVQQTVSSSNNGTSAEDGNSDEAK